MVAGMQGRKFIINLTFDNNEIKLRRNWKILRDDKIEIQMGEYDDLERYNGDQKHDMWVDFSNYENTGDLEEVFEDDEDEEEYEDFDEEDFDDFDEEEYYEEEDY